MTTTHPSFSPGHLLLPVRHASGSRMLATDGLELARNARSAIFRAGYELRSNQRDEVLVPAFHCPSGVMPLLAAGLKPVYYRIRPDLTLDLADLLSKLSRRTTAVMVIHFFGHPTPLEGLLPLLQQGVALIEDWSHSFMDSSGLRLTGCADTYRIYSFWKLLPSGIGGGLVRPTGRSGSLTLRRRSDPRDALVQWKRMLEESIMAKGRPWLRRTYQSLENARLSLTARGRSAEARPGPEQIRVEEGERYYSFDRQEALDDMPARVRRWIASCDLPAIARARRDNYAVFAASLRGHPNLCPVFEHVPPTAPWVFPVLVADRDKRDRAWRDQGVALHTFGPYLHSGLFRQGGDEMIRDARFLASHLLCLSVHQDLSPVQIETACSLLSTSR